MPLFFSFFSFFFPSSSSSFFVLAERLQSLGAPVQEAQVRLPADADGAGEQAAVLEGDEREAEGRDGRPQLARVDEADGDRVADAAPGLAGRVA